MGATPPAVRPDPIVGCTHPTKRPSHSNSSEERYPSLNRPVIEIMDKSVSIEGAESCFDSLFFEKMSSSVTPAAVRLA